VVILPTLSSAEDALPIGRGQMGGEDVVLPKVPSVLADEVGERGAFRMVNRISRAAMVAI
jgi:hypothetical protein